MGEEEDDDQSAGGRGSSACRRREGERPAYPLADLLVRQSAGPGGADAAPTFERYRFHDGAPCKDQLRGLCTESLDAYPSLGGDNGVHRLIGLLPPV